MVKDDCKTNGIVYPSYCTWVVNKEINTNHIHSTFQPSRLTTPRHLVE